MTATTLRAALAAIAAGNGQRPRGHAVTAEEFRAVAPFAGACRALVSDTFAAENDSWFNDEPGASEGRVYAPSEALPLLP